MKKERYRADIKKCLEQLGTYKKEFDIAIESLSRILEKRDICWDEWEQSGGEVVINHINQAGASNPTKHPALTAYNELNTQALAYLKELGLTVTSLKKIGEIKEDKTDALTEAIKAFKLG